MMSSVKQTSHLKFFGLDLFSIENRFAIHCLHKKMMGDLQWHDFDQKRHFKNTIVHPTLNFN